VKIGPIVIRSYNALLYLGLLVGAILVYREVEHRELEPRAVIDVALGAAGFGLLLGRATYVGFHWAYYETHLREAARLWEGGLAWQGAVIGGTVGAIIVSAMRGERLLTMLDVLTPGTASVATLAWLACHTVGCAYGMETYPGDGLLWTLSRDLPNLYGIREPRVAVQLLGAGWSGLLVAAILLTQQRLRPAGMVFALWLILQSTGAFALGFLRADDVVRIGGWRADQIVNLGLVATGLLTAVVRMVTPAGRPSGGESGGRLYG